MCNIYDKDFEKIKVNEDICIRQFGPPPYGHRSWYERNLYLRETYLPPKFEDEKSGDTK